MMLCYICQKPINPDKENHVYVHGNLFLILAKDKSINIIYGENSFLDPDKQITYRELGSACFHVGCLMQHIKILEHPPPSKVEQLLDDGGEDKRRRKKRSKVEEGEAERQSKRIIF